MSFKRNPAVQCWIRHLLEGQYDETQKFFYTIFGNVKRIRIIATIIDKKEILIDMDETEIGLEEMGDSNIRLDFDLDDGTGMIRATIRNINPDKFKALNRGDIVEVTGRVSKFKDFVSLWIEFVRKVDEPNLVLLRNAEIINRIKHGDIQEIPEFINSINDIEEFSDEIDVTSLFESEDDSFKLDEIKEKIYSIVEEYSSKGNGINFEKLKQVVKIPENDLRTYINDLILESRIYESDNDIFEAF
ncbi:MAG: OB-fold nucleic acid binding domain-containing protein [Candidatus Hodarchaeota archaeon]